MAKLSEIGMAENSRKEEGCLMYEYFPSAEDENVIVLILTVTPGATYNAADYEMQQLLSQFKKEFGASLLLVWK